MRPFGALPLVLAASGAAQGSIVGTADLTPQDLGGGNFHYSAVVTNTGTTKIGAFWFAWIPGIDFLPVAPTNVASPSGWSASVTQEGGATDGYGIEWVANATSAINTGGSLAGFSFDVHASPSDLMGFSKPHPAYHTTTSFLYVGTPLVTQGYQFIANVVPAPAAPVCLLASVALLARRRR